VKHNGQPVVAVSELTPNLAMLYPGERPVVACPSCGTWRVPRRGMLPAHRYADEATRCAGSGQRIDIDLTPAQWRETLRLAIREAARRRGTRVRRTPKPVVTPPTFRIIAAR